MKNKVSPNDSYELDEYDAENKEGYRLDGKYTKYLLFCLVMATLGAGFQVGWSTAIFNTPSAVIKAFYVKVYFNQQGTIIDEDRLNALWAVTNGLMPAGGMLGGLLSGFVADHLGRKNALICVNVIVIISAVLNIISKFIGTYITVMISRFLAGVYSGFFTGILPLYLNECSSKNLRGFSGTMNQLAIVLGVVVVNIIGLPDLLGTVDLWPVLVGLTLVPIIFHAVLFFLSESPKYVCINKHDREGAKHILMKLRDNDEELVDNELNEIQKEKASHVQKASWLDLFKKEHLLKPLIVTIMVQMSQQLTGINAVTFYSTDIFRSAGLDGDWPVYATIILGVVQLVMTIVCMFIVDRAGRKLLLLIGMIGLAVFSFGLALCRIFADENNEWLNYLTIVCAVLYMIFFSIGPGAIPWLITSELFGANARGKATSIAVFVNWFSNFLVTVTFPFIEAAIGSYSFFIFGSIAVFFVFYTLFFVPETKHKHIEDIVEMFKKRNIFLF